MSFVSRRKIQEAAHMRRVREEKEDDTYQDMENVNRENAYQKLADRISLLEAIVYEYLESERLGIEPRK